MRTQHQFKKKHLFSIPFNAQIVNVWEKFCFVLEMGFESEIRKIYRANSSRSSKIDAVSDIAQKVRRLAADVYFSFICLKTIYT